MNKQNVVYIHVTYYSAINRKYIHTTTWMNILICTTIWMNHYTERSQLQKIAYCMIIII